MQAGRRHKSRTRRTELSLDLERLGVVVGNSKPRLGVGRMPKYLFKGSYSPESLAGVLKEGGTGRRKAVEKMLAGVGGKLEAFYYAFGETDVWAIVDVPDDTTAAALSMTISSAGGAGIETVKLLTPEQIDEAAERPIDYRPPGK